MPSGIRKFAEKSRQRGKGCLAVSVAGSACRGEDVWAGQELGLRQWQGWGLKSRGFGSEWAMGSHELQTGPGEELLGVPTKAPPPPKHPEHAPWSRMSKGAENCEWGGQFQRGRLPCQTHGEVTPGSREAGVGWRSRRYSRASEGVGAMGEG